MSTHRQEASGYPGARTKMSLARVVAALAALALILLLDAPWWESTVPDFSSYTGSAWTVYKDGQDSVIAVLAVIALLALMRGPALAAAIPAGIAAVWVGGLMIDGLDGVPEGQQINLYWGAWASLGAALVLVAASLVALRKEPILEGDSDGYYRDWARLHPIRAAVCILIVALLLFMAFVFATGIGTSDAIV